MILLYLSSIHIPTVSDVPSYTLHTFCTRFLFNADTTPHAPYNVTALFGHYHIQLSWKPGFDGGHKQSYVIA